MTLTSDPAQVDLASGDNTSVNLTVRLTTTDADAGQHPRKVRVTPSPGLLAACDPAGTLAAAACMINTWTIGGQPGTLVSSHVIRVGAANHSPPRSWTLTLETDDRSLRTPVSVRERSPQDRQGRYRGGLVLTSGPPAVELPVEAVVTATQILLHDRTRIIAPTGTALLNLDGSPATTSFLAGSSQAQLYKKDTITFKLGSNYTFDPATGTLNGTVQTSVASSPANQQSWTLQLLRSGPLITAAPCPTGDVFDASRTLCVPGVLWDPAVAASTVEHADATAWLRAMAPRIDDPKLSADGAVPLAERFLCYDSVRSSNRGFPVVATPTLTAPISGDLMCGYDGPPNTNSLATDYWRGIGLLSDRDRSPSPVPGQIKQYEMLNACMAQLVYPPNPIAQDSDLANANATCVSPARFFPALFAVAGTLPYRWNNVPGAPQYERRSRLLFNRLVQQWAQLTGFIARDGTAQRTTANIVGEFTSKSADETTFVTATNTGVPSYAALLDKVDGALTLLLDQRILKPLLATPAAELASPDYREFKKPIAYWTFDDGDPGRTTTSVPSFVTGPVLTSPGGCLFNNSRLMGSTSCNLTATLPVLTTNVTVALRMAHPAWSDTSTLIDSDGLQIWLSVRPDAGTTLWIGRNGAAALPFHVLDSDTVVIRRAVLDGQNVRYSVMTQRAGDLTSVNVPTPSYGTNSTIAVGSQRGLSAANLKGFLSEVAIWDAALSDSEARDLLTRYTSGIRHPAWPGGVSLPDPADKVANEAKVGIPVMLLESLIPAAELVEAFIHKAALDSQSRCRRSQPSDQPQIDKERAARSLRLISAVQQLAETLRAAAATVDWATRYDQAAGELAAARAKAVKALVDAAECEKPFGMGPKEYPLFFTAPIDTGHPNDPLEASARFLQTKTGTTEGTTPSGLIGAAAQALTQARSAWAQQYSSAVQQELTETERANRIHSIQATYGRDLIDLCGVPDSDGAATILDSRFLHPIAGKRALTSANCHIQETSICNGAENIALDRVDPGCLRGQIGEAWVAAQSAHARVVAAQIDWKGAQEKHANQYARCVQLSRANTSQLANDLLEVAQDETNANDAFNFVISLAEVVGGAGTSSGGVAASGVSGLVQSGLDLIGGFSQRKTALQTMLNNRAEQEKQDQCWLDAAQLDIPLDSAEQHVTVALSELTGALFHAKLLQDRVTTTVVEASAALDREDKLPRPRIAFHYWADELLEVYQHRMERARRITYLFLRAVEHDLQTILDKDAAVLGATNPEQLNTIAVDLGNQLDGQEFHSAPLHKVLSVCNDILRLPERYHDSCDDSNSQSARRFREILFSPAAATYAENGEYLGQQIPFRLTPEMINITGRCAERLSTVAARLASGATDVSIKIAKRETFYSQTCPRHVNDIGKIQEGTLRLSRNLLMEGESSSFDTDLQWKRGTVRPDAAGDDSFENTLAPPYSISDLAGRGMYGDYAVIVAPETLRDLIGKSPNAADIRIRFDFFSFEGQGAPAPINLAPTIAIYDGAGKSLDNTNEHSVTCVGCGVQGPLPQPPLPPLPPQTLTATAGAGWQFAGWSGACTGLATCSMAVAVGHKVSATFVDQRTAALTVTGAGQGSVAAGWGSVAPGAPNFFPNVSSSSVFLSVPNHATVLLVPRPAPNAVFTGWGGACADRGLAPCALEMSAGGAVPAVSASFALKPRVIVTMMALTTATSAPFSTPPAAYYDSRLLNLISGGVLKRTCIDSCEYAGDQGETVRLQGRTDQVLGWGFRQWFETTATSCHGGNSLCDVALGTMGSSKSASAGFFKYPVLTLTYSPIATIIGTAPGWGIQCGNGFTTCSAPVAPGVPITFTHNDGGNSFSHWTDGALQCGSSAQCVIALTDELTVGMLVNQNGPGGGDDGGCGVTGGGGASTNLIDDGDCHPGLTAGRAQSAAPR